MMRVLTPTARMTQWLVFLRPKRSTRGRPAVYQRGVFTNTCLFVCWRHDWLWGLFMNTLFVNTFMFTFVYLSHLVNTSLCDFVTFDVNAIFFKDLLPKRCKTGKRKTSERRS